MLLFHIFNRKWKHVQDFLNALRYFRREILYTSIYLRAVIFQNFLISGFQNLLLRHVNDPAWREAKEDLSNILPHGEHVTQFVL